MSQETNTCPICGGTLNIAYTITFEQCKPTTMRYDPPQIERLCMGHPALDNVARFRNLLELGLTTEGAHRKQWILWEIGRMFNLDLSDIDADEGVVP